ncbi:MAG: hypothetical protein HY231_22190 [Acidobacteria bacterium]|nr:hypothetical protein [Acidobacteriota bacterium]
MMTDYGGGKWGRYLRAPDFYFEIMREFGHRFTRIGEIATIKFGIKSGCDAFFMPRNVSAELLAKCKTEDEWRALPLMKRCKRAEVESGDVVIVKCGDNTLHPIESEYVKPEVHSLMQVDRPVVTADQLDRVVLWVNEPLNQLKGKYVHHFITWGSKQTFASNKSKSVPVPERSTIAGRPVWYDLTGLEPGIGFWPKAQQYRHIIPANTYGLNCNCNLYDIHSLTESSIATRALMPVLNSTLIALMKTFYGRYAGTEGNLKTEVVDSLLIEIPDPRNVTAPILERLEKAFASMKEREVTHLVEEAFRKFHTAEEVREAENIPLTLPLELTQEDRRELDDAVFELLGVTDPKRREKLIDQLYREVILHFRAVRIVEVQKMEQRRRGSGKDKISISDLALDAWNELEPEWQKPFVEWIAQQATQLKTIRLPDGEARLPDATNFFEATTVYFGKKPAVSLVCDSRAEAELVFAITQTGLHGDISVPTNEKECSKVVQALETRLAEGKTKLEELAQQRAGSDKLREQMMNILYRWFIHGKTNG